MKQVKWMLAALIAPAFVLVADDPESSITVNNTVVSNYVWRGSDLFTNYARQKGQAQGSNTGTWAYQPSITFNPPSSGLSFNIWGSFALDGRQDRDMDGVVQTSAGGADLWASRYSTDFDKSFQQYDGGTGTTEVIETEITKVRQGVETSGLEATCTADGSAKPNCGLPGLYKEKVGLKRLDEIDLTLDYTFETNQGNYSFGIVRYMHPGPFDQSTAFLDETYVSYAPPGPLSDLSVTAWASSSQWFYTVAYAPSIALSGDEDGPSLGLNVATSYKVMKNKQGHSNSDVGVSFNAQGFSVGLNATYRHDCRFFDADTDTDLPLRLEGGSNNRDCQTQDYSQTDGLLNSWKTNVVGNEIKKNLTTALGSSHFIAKNYKYTPRQALPKVLYWLSIGYETSI